VRHIRSSNVGYDGTHGGSGYGFRNGDSFRILEFADKLNLVICNTLFMKQESKLVTYVAGLVKSTVDYIMVWPVVYWGVYAGIRRIPTSGFFDTSVIINKQGTSRPFATPLCVYPPPFLAIHHWVWQEDKVKVRNVKVISREECE